MSISFWASCLRIANISSCLRMVEAFSTLCSSAKPSNSVGDLDLRSWSFISRMRVILVDDRRKYADQEDGRERTAGRWRSETLNLWPDTAGGSLIGPPSKVSACVR